MASATQRRACEYTGCKANATMVLVQPTIITAIFGGSTNYYCKKHAQAMLKMQEEALNYGG